MVLLGILLIAIAIGGGTLLFLGTSSLDDKVTVPVLGGSIQLPSLALFLAGAACTLLLWLGWVLVRAGAKRARRNRAEAKENARLAAEQRRQGELDVERARREGQERVAEQREATETARRRAEVAEQRNDSTP